MKISCARSSTSSRRRTEVVNQGEHALLILLHQETEGLGIPLLCTLNPLDFLGLRAGVFHRPSIISQPSLISDEGRGFMVTLLRITKYSDNGVCSGARSLP